jgi:hypothetical protein
MINILSIKTDNIEPKRMHTRARENSCATRILNMQGGLFGSFFQKSKTTSGGISRIMKGRETRPHFILILNDLKGIELKKRKPTIPANGKTIYRTKSTYLYCPSLCHRIVSIS